MLLQAAGHEFVDDDFAEFDFDEEEFEMATNDKKAAQEANDDDDEEFEDEEPPPSKGARRPLPDDSDDEARVEQELDEDDEFTHFADEEEFEGFMDDEDGPRAARGPSPPPPQTINIAKVPAHLSRNWENYLLEILMCAGIVVYFLNFFTGKSRNARIAGTWFDTHRALLESNFALVGDDGAKEVEKIDTPLVKESEHGFTLWCSGRIGCQGMLVEIRLLKRQDLVSVIANLMKPSHDQVRF